MAKETKETEELPEVEAPQGARFILGNSVVDANGVAVEGLSVKDGAIVGKEKTADK